MLNSRHLMNTDMTIISWKSTSMRKNLLRLLLVLVLSESAQPKLKI